MVLRICGGSERYPRLIAETERAIPSLWANSETATDAYRWPVSSARRNDSSETILLDLTTVMTTTATRGRMAADPISNSILRNIDELK